MPIQSVGCLRLNGYENRTPRHTSENGPHRYVGDGIHDIWQFKRNVTNKQSAGFPLGHFPPEHLAKLFNEECALIGGLVIAWGQFDNELCSLFSRLLGYSYKTPTDERAKAVYFSSTNAKARRDAMVSLIKTIDDELCREWLNKAVGKAIVAAGKRNNIIHSEYFADIFDASGSYLKQNKPAAKISEVIRKNIQQQLIDAVSALADARFYMEFAFAATKGRESLEQTLMTYEPALRERGE